MSKVRTGLSLLAAAVSVSGCMTAAAAYQAALDHVDVGDFAWSRGEGPGSISGRALTDESLKAGAVCETVELRPAGFGVEMKDRHLELAPPLFKPGFDVLFRTARCDAQGRFRFERLPVGRYYLVAGVPTEVMAEDGNRYPEWIVKAVTVGAGETRVELRRVCRVLMKVDKAYDYRRALYVCDVAPFRRPDDMFEARTAEDKAMVRSLKDRIGVAPTGSPIRPDER